MEEEIEPTRAGTLPQGAASGGSGAQQGGAPSAESVITSARDDELGSSTMASSSGKSASASGSGSGSTPRFLSLATSPLRRGDYRGGAGTSNDDDDESTTRLSVDDSTTLSRPAATDEEQSWEFTIATQPALHRLVPTQVQQQLNQQHQPPSSLVRRMDNKTNRRVSAGDLPGGGAPNPAKPSRAASMAAKIPPVALARLHPHRASGVGGGSFRGSLRGSTRKSAKSKRLSEYTVDKLQFSKLGRLYGRDREVSELWEAWQDISGSSRAMSSSLSTTASTTLSTASSERDSGGSEALPTISGAADDEASKAIHSRRRFVTVFGASGTGKSALAETLKTKVLRSGGLFLTGKFPQLFAARKGILKAGGGGDSSRQLQQVRSASSVEPYAAFVAACNELCDFVVNLDDDERQNPSWYQERTAKYRKYFKFTLADLKAQLSAELGKDAAVLAKVIPGLLQILPHPALSSEVASFGDDSIGYREAQHQFKFAFRKFLRIVSSFSPLVMVLDDLQWADVASMELLEALLSDRESSGGVLVIGSYRDDDCYAQMPHLSAIATINEYAAQDPGLKVTSIAVGNLTVAQVNELLVDLLSASSSDETLGLAECVYRKTLGNIFFVIQFLTLLEDMDLLEFNFGIMKWKWDLKAILQQTAATENVVELMKAKMQGLPSSIGKALPIMACLGSTFSSTVFELVASHFVWEEEPDFDEADEFECAEEQDGHEEDGREGDPAKDEDVRSQSRASSFEGGDAANASEETGEPAKRDDEQAPELSAQSPSLSQTQQTALALLQTCEDQGLIEKASDLDGSGYSSYQWVHDKIQEAACALMSDDDFNALKLQLGTIMFDGFEDSMLEKNLFIVANLLNTDSPDPSSLPRQRPLDVAKLFLRAGVRTIQNSAFDQATGYLLAGIRLLPPNHWHDHYELTLDLYSTAAEAEFCTGNFDRMTEYCNEVIKQVNRPLLDKRRVYNVMIDSTGAAGGQPAALALCRDILSKLGCKFPNRAVTLHVLGGIVQIKSALKKSTSKELIANLPSMEDPNKQWALVLLDKFITYAYMLKSDLLPLAIFKGMKITMRDGIYFYSPVMFALVGLSLAAFVHDYKAGVAFGDQAVEMLNQVKSSRKVHARVMLLVHSFVFNWLRPITLSIKPLLGGYQIGMAMGDTENAAWCIYFSLEYSFRTGTPLDTLLADCAFYSEQLREVKQLKIHAVLLNLWQSALLLTGDNDFDGTFTGDIVKEQKALAEAGDFEAYLFVAINRMFMYVAFVLGEHSLVYDSLKRTEMDKGGYEKVFPGIAGIYHLYAFNGLSMISLYRRTLDKKYLKLAKKFVAKIRSWAVMDNPNVSQYAALMDAELESLKGDHYAASKSYEVAILYAGRRGLTQDRALAHERYGEHLLRLGKERDQDAEFQISEAVKLYEEWGAHAKVRLMSRLYHNLLSPPSEIQIETGG